MMDEETVPMRETAEEAAVPVQGSETSDWEVTRRLDELDLHLRAVTSLPWRVQEDPDPSRGYYISGPPETRIVAEGMREEDARSLVHIANTLNETVEQVRDVITLWEALEDGSLNSYSEMSSYVEVVNRYQKHIAQLSGNPAPVPEASTAGELNFMHVGNTFNIPGIFDTKEEPLPYILSITHMSNGYVKIRIGNMGSTNLVILPKDAEVEVNIPGSTYYPEPSDPLETVEVKEPSEDEAD